MSGGMVMKPENFRSNGIRAVGATNYA